VIFKNFTSDEFKFFEKANRIVAETLSLLIKNVKVGMTTLELDKIAEDYILSNNARPAFKNYGSKKNPFPFTICASVNEVVVHGFANDKKLVNGDILSLDCGAEYKGFYGDSAVSCLVGDVPDDIKQLSQRTEEALFKGIAKATEGNKVYDISRAVQSYVEGFGYSVTRELVGHGIGDKLHDEPPVPNFVPLLLHRQQYPNMKLVKGLAIAIEPMVHLGAKETKTASDGWTVYTKDKKAAAHWEHTIVIDNSKPIIMTLR
jgi:methionyl aminopeptidase